MPSLPNPPSAPPFASTDSPLRPSPASLLGLLLTWVADGFPRYPSMEDNQTIAYISDLGAQRLKPLFIAGCVLTTVTLDSSLVADRVLRHRGVLAASTTLAQSVLSGIAIVCAVAGTVGLILLSIFDTLYHKPLHDAFLALFIAGYVVCAAFLCAEFQRLGRKYRQHRVLRLSFWAKLVFIIVEVGLAIGFGVCNRTRNFNVAAILEWVIAFVFTFWVLSFVMDLAPAGRGDQRNVPRTKMAAAAVVATERRDEEYGMGHHENGYRGTGSAVGGRPNPAGNF